MGTDLAAIDSGNVLVHPAEAKMPLPAKARGISPEAWHVMKTVLFKGASDEMICTLVDYCKARKLDPLKKPFHIVNVWDSDAGKMAESIWPSIGELRTTAMRTGEYAGKREIIFGPDIKRIFDKQEYTFPEWAQCTVYRMVKGHRVEFAGSRVYWLETYASKKTGAPNSMWARRSRGQLAKCAEAEALRSAFPEETGGEPTSEEMAGQSIGAENAKDVTPRDISRASAPPLEILVIDPDGEERLFLVGEVEAQITQWCRECTDEQLAQLAENNLNVATIRDAVEAEELRRASKAQQPDLPLDDPDPCKIEGLDAKSAISALEYRIEQADSAEGDRLLAVYRERLEKISPKAYQALGEIVARKIRGRDRLS